MRIVPLFVLITILAGCSWETYQKEDGKTGLRPKYEAGTRVYYQDGSYSRNMHYNGFRPEPHAVKPDVAEPKQVGGTKWQSPIK